MCLQKLSLLVLAGSLAVSAQNSSEAISKSGLDLKAIDKSVNPCDDFYQYACGAWVHDNPIPADESSWSRFSELNNRVQTDLRAILEDAGKNQSRSATDQKIGAFYGACMDETTREHLGAKPLQPDLDRIREMRDKAAVIGVVADLYRRGIPAFFSFGPAPDPRDARNNIADLDQGGLGLPERDYYFRDDADSKELRAKYVAHIARMFVLAGETKAKADAEAQTVMAIETALAQASLDVTSRRNPELLVHKMSAEQLKGLSSEFDFLRFFNDLKIPAPAQINVDVPDFVKGFSAVVQKQDLASLKLYLEWKLLHAAAPHLNAAFVKENFEFYGHALYGQSEQRPQWKRCVASTDEELGDALGQKFVEKTFGEEGKARTLKIVREIEHEMEEDIRSSTWMTEATKVEAEHKLKAVVNRIGYPDKWRDYAGVQISPTAYFADCERTTEYETQRDLNKIGKPVDREEWGMTPPTINAYYDPTANNINFPAGILQPPFFNKAADQAVNYGSIGAVIGHELTHGFDDEGRKFDADGNLKEWWQKQDAANYEKLSSCIADEYSAFTVLPGLNENGKLTLGENTADNGGLRLAYRALMDDLASKTGAAGGALDGYTAEQRFFVGFAQNWCNNTRPEAIRERTQADPHAVGKYRVDGTVTNMPEFSHAFGCKETDRRSAAHACRVW